LLRYVLRPPVAEERVELRPGESVEVEPRADGILRDTPGPPAGRRSVRRTTVRAAGCRRPR